MWSTPRKDASEQSSDLRKAEIFINNRGSSGGGSPDSSGGSGGRGTFCCFEQYRQVTQARRQGAVGDYASWWEFTPEWGSSGSGEGASGSSGGGGGGGGGGAGGAAPPRRARVRQRVAAFLQPQDALYFEAGARAAALYDYAYEFERVL